MSTSEKIELSAEDRVKAVQVMCNIHDEDWILADHFGCLDEMEDPYKGIHFGE